MIRQGQLFIIKLKTALTFNHTQICNILNFKLSYKKFKSNKLFTSFRLVLLSSDNSILVWCHVKNETVAIGDCRCIIIMMRLVQKSLCIIHKYELILFT